MLERAVLFWKSLQPYYPIKQVSDRYKRYALHRSIRKSSAQFVYSSRWLSKKTFSNKEQENLGEVAKTNRRDKSAFGNVDIYYCTWIQISLMLLRCHQTLICANISLDEAFR